MNYTLTNLGSDLTHIVDLTILNNDSIVVDAGAAKGNFIMGFRPYMPNCKIISLECNKANLEYIRAHLNDPGVILLEKALVGEDSGEEVEFTSFKGHNGRYYQWGNIYGNHKDANLPLLEPPSSYKVPTTTLKKIINEYKLEKIDYLKLDIEGAEDEVLCTLEPEYKQKIIQISLEYHSDEIKQNILKQFDGWYIKDFPQYHELYIRKL